MAIQVGMFHGGKSLCEPKKTSTRLVETDGPETGTCEWEQSLKFDLEVIIVKFKKVYKFIFELIYFRYEIFLEWPNYVSLYLKYLSQPKVYVLED